MLIRFIFLMILHLLFPDITMILFIFLISDMILSDFSGLMY